MRYGTGVALTLSAAQVDILSHKCCVCVDTKRDHGGQENNSRLSLCGIWGKIWRALGTTKNTKGTLRYGTGVALTLSAAQVDILSHKCCVCVDTKRDHGGQENNSRLSLCGIWGKIWRALGTKKNTKVTLQLRRKFAPVEGLNHDLVCTGSIYHVHFAWQVWHGQLLTPF